MYDLGKPFGERMYQNQCLDVKNLWSKIRFIAPPSQITSLKPISTTLASARWAHLALAMRVSWSFVNSVQTKITYPLWFYPLLPCILFPQWWPH